MKKIFIILLFLIPLFFGFINNVFTQEQKKNFVTLRFKSTGPGEITPTPAYYLFEVGKNVVLTASTVENKHKFLYWKQNDTIISTSNILIYNIPKHNSIVKAYFTENEIIMFKHNGKYVHNEITIPSNKKNTIIDVVLNNKKFPNYVLYSFVNSNTIENIESSIINDNTHRINVNINNKGSGKLIVSFSLEGIIYTNQIKINVY